MEGLKMRPPCNLVSLSFLTFMSTHDEAKAQGRQDQTAKAVESNVGTDGDSSLYPGRVGRPLFPSQMSIMGRDGLPASLKSYVGPDTERSFTPSTPTTKPKRALKYESGPGAQTKVIKTVLTEPDDGMKVRPLLMPAVYCDRTV